MRFLSYLPQPGYNACRVGLERRDMIDQLSADNSGKVVRVASHPLDQRNKRQAKVTHIFHRKVRGQAIVLSSGQRMFTLGDVSL
jgi:hypothetical protein